MLCLIFPPLICYVSSFYVSSVLVVVVDKLSPIEETSLGYVSRFAMIFFFSFIVLHLADVYLSDVLETVLVTPSLSRVLISVEQTPAN